MTKASPNETIFGMYAWYFFGIQECFATMMMTVEIPKAKAVHAEDGGIGSLSAVMATATALQAAAAGCLNLHVSAWSGSVMQGYTLVYNRKKPVAGKIARQLPKICAQNCPLGDALRR